MYYKTIIMKKLLLSLAVVLVTAFSVNAQSYTLSWDGEMLGDTVILEGTPDAEIEFHALLTNNSADTDTIKIVRRFIEILDGVSHYFCWGSCYAPNPDSIFAPNGSVILEPGETTEDYVFSGHYNPQEVLGTSLVEYTFFNQSDENEKLIVVAKYVVSPDAIDENILNNMSVSDIYPNPAENLVNIDYIIPAEVETASVKIVNILGSVVKEQYINTGSNKMTLDVSGLNGGIYFYSVTINGEIYSTKRMIIR